MRISRKPDLNSVAGEGKESWKFPQTNKVWWMGKKAVLKLSMICWGLRSCRQRLSRFAAGSAGRRSAWKVLTEFQTELDWTERTFVGEGIRGQQEGNFEKRCEWKHTDKDKNKRLPELS